MDHEFRSAEERRAAIVALTQKETGIDESMIETLVRAFYARVRKDELLAPIFETRISVGGPISKHVRILVVAGASDRTLSRPADGETHAFGRGRASLRSMACAVRGNGARPLPPGRGREIRRTRSPRRRETGARRRERQRRAPWQGRALSARSVIEGITCRKRASAALFPCPR
jgi:hypothetical protein